MKQGSTPVRVFRVLDDRGPYSLSFVCEYIDLGEFKCWGGSEFGDGLQMERNRKANDRRDMFGALNSLRDRALYGEPPDSLIGFVSVATVARTIDEAVSQYKARIREFRERLLRGESPSPPTRPSGTDPEISIIAVPRHGGPSPEERRQMIRNERGQRDYARGRRLRWKRMGRTPAGLEYEVLTVDGVEKLYPGSK